MRELWGDLDPSLEERWQWTLPLQCLRSLTSTAYFRNYGFHDLHFHDHGFHYPHLHQHHHPLVNAVDAASAMLAASDLILNPEMKNICHRHHHRFDPDPDHHSHHHHFVGGGKYG